MSTAWRVRRLGGPAVCAPEDALGQREPFGSLAFLRGWEEEVWEASTCFCFWDRVYL